MNLSNLNFLLIFLLLSQRSFIWYARKIFRKNNIFYPLFFPLVSFKLIAACVMVYAFSQTFWDGPNLMEWNKKI